MRSHIQIQHADGDGNAYEVERKIVHSKGKTLWTAELIKSVAEMHQMCASYVLTEDVLKNSSTIKITQPLIY